MQAREREHAADADDDGSDGADGGADARGHADAARVDVEAVL